MAAMALEIRTLTADDEHAAWQLLRDAFGGPRQRPESRRPPVTAGEHSFGAFDGGRLVGHATGLEHAYFYGGRAVPGAGVASVAVAPEHRTGGMVGALLGPLVAEAR